MKLSLVYTLGFLLFGSTLYAADSSATWVEWKNFEKAKVLNAKAVDQQKDNNKIRSIEVMDLRCEKSSIGSYTGKSQKPYIITTEDRLSSLFNSKLSNDTSGQILLAVIQDLWISESNLFFINKVKYHHRRLKLQLVRKNSMLPYFAL